MQEVDNTYQIIWLTRRLFRALAQKSDDSLQDLGISVADRAVMAAIGRKQTIDVRFGSQADLFTDITPTAASEGKPDVRDRRNWSGPRSSPVMSAFPQSSRSE